MKRVLKWIGIALGGLLVLVVVIAAGLFTVGTVKLNRTIDVDPVTVTIPDDAAALARGEHLVNVYCVDCHGADLAGGPFFDETPIASIHAPNLTGLAATPPEELVKAIRHGLDSEGRRLFIMPAESFIYFSAADLGAIIGHLQILPPAGNATPPPEFRPLGRIMVGLGVFDRSIPATYIDHNLPYPAMPEVGPTVAYGEYMARFCRGCHGANLAGGQPPAPDSPLAPNLTPGGALVGWTAADFLAALRTGVRPSGTTIDAESMPWTSIGKLDEAELRALWLYLQSLPPLETVSQ